MPQKSGRRSQRLDHELYVTKAMSKFCYSLIGFFSSARFQVDCVACYRLFDHQETRGMQEKRKADHVVASIFCMEC